MTLDNVRSQVSLSLALVPAPMEEASEITLTDREREGFGETRLSSPANVATFGCGIGSMDSSFVGGFSRLGVAGSTGFFSSVSFAALVGCSPGVGVATGAAIVGLGGTVFTAAHVVGGEPAVACGGK